MTPIAGFLIAVLAGWFVRDAFRAAAAVVIPWLAVLTAQTWIIAAGRGASPPGTVSHFPQAVGYWLVQAIFFALALGIAGLLASLRARGGKARSAASTRRQAVIAVGVLVAATAVFTPVYLLASQPVHHHSAQGSPPAQGVAGMILCVVTFAVLSVLAFRRRRAAAKLPLADASADMAAAGPRSQTPC